MALVAAFGSLQHAEAAARFLTERGVPGEVIGVRSRASSGPRGGGRTRVPLPLIYAVFGALLTGLIGTVLWTVLAPDALTTGWRAVVCLLVGATASGSIGVVVETGLDLPFLPQAVSAHITRPPRQQDSAVVAVRESQVHHAAELLRDIGVDRILVDGTTTRRPAADHW